MDANSESLRMSLGSLRRTSSCCDRSCPKGTRGDHPCAAAPGPARTRAGHLRAYALRPRHAESRRMSLGSFRRDNSCSQIRRTFQPRLRRVRVTRRSRDRLAAIFFRQKAALFRGWMKCRGHPCQKQPSTNTASLRARKTKSGRTLNFPLSTLNWRLAPRRQPPTPCARKIAINRSSVSLLPALRMRDIDAGCWASNQRPFAPACRNNADNLRRFPLRRSLRPPMCHP